MDYYYNLLSAPCRSVLLTASALGVKLNLKSVDLMKGEQKKPEFVAINPQHCVPTLVDGDLKLWESRAICAYLVNQYGKDDSLYPKDPKTRAEVDRFLYFDMGTLYKRFGDYAYPVLMSQQTPDPEKLKTLHEALAWLNGYLDGNTYAVGSAITIADHVLVASVSSFEESGIDLSSYGNVTAWLGRCKTNMPGYEQNDEGAKTFGAWGKDKLK